MKNLSRRAALLGVFGFAAGLSAKEKKKKRKQSETLGLLAGTVFHSGGMSYPGVLVAVFAADAEKPEWKGLTDGRGEFAIRVPATAEGIKYRVVVETKGFKTLEHEMYAYEAQRSTQNFLLKKADQLDVTISAIKASKGTGKK